MHRTNKPVFTFAALLLPVAFLGVVGFYLNTVQPVPLTLSSVKNNVLPSKSGKRNIQMILWLKHPTGKPPQWWGQPMDSQSQVLAQLKNSNSRLFSGADVNGCSYDITKQQYRVPVHFVVPFYGRWKQQRTLSFEIELSQKGRQKGVVQVETSWPLSS